MGRSLPQFFLVQRQPQGLHQQPEDVVSLAEHPQTGDAVLLSLLEVNDHRPEAVPVQGPVGCLGGHGVTVEATEAGPQHQHQVRLPPGLLHPLEDVPPDGAVIAHHGVGGVVPGAVDLQHVLLRKARLLRQPVVVLLDPVRDEAGSPELGQSSVSQGGLGVRGEVSQLAASPGCGGDAGCGGNAGPGVNDRPL